MPAPNPRRRQPSDQIVQEPPSEDPEEELTWSDEEGTTVEGVYIPPPPKTFASLGSGKRLIITKIVNNFFKSYATDTVLGPFSKCFNAIVGPNGSGKSNVIDSMLFVFGYRAAKIRCKKLSVLLHNSETYKHVQSCTVAVHFCEIIDKEGEAYEVVPNSEFVVARTAYRDNSSAYELNGRKVQFKVIAKLLREHGVDLDHNRFLILQGEVEEIAMMKCKGASPNETGMLEYLEDIIGTTRYKKPLAELTDKIENLSVLRTEKLNRLSLMQKELDELKGPMEDAVGFLKAENKIVTCKNFLYQKQVHELREQLQEIEEDKVKITERRDALLETLKSLASQKSEKEKLLKSESGKYGKLEQRKDQLKEAFNAADKRDTQLQAEMVQINTNRKKYKQQLEDERKKLVQLEKVPEQNKASILECEEREADLLEQKELLDAEKSKLLANIRDETKDLQVEKEQLETELAQLRRSVDETKSAYDITDFELKLAQSKEDDERNKLEKLRETLSNNETTIQQRTEEVSQLKKKIPLTEKSLRGAHQELETIRREEGELSKDIRKSRVSLEETRSAMQSSRSRGKVLDSLMNQKQAGKCPGFYGRLGDLGAIDMKYDVAVSTACGPLDYVVVDTMETGQWCIEFLKKHDVGRVSCIVLEKQEHLRGLAEGRIQTPENVHRLYDLIKIQDPAVKTAFYFALKDTLVADNLDQATKIAYGAQRFRVVTLKGELIEVSGTISGGGKTVSRGRMGQSVAAATTSPKGIQKMETSLQQKEERLRELMLRQTNLESQINALQPEVNTMKLNLKKFALELQELKAQQPLLEQQIQKQEKVAKATKSDQTQIQRLTATLESNKKAYDKASAAAEKIQVQVDKLTEAIREKTTGKMKKVDKSLSEATKTIDKCKAEITRLRVAITTSERNSKKCAQKITTLEQNITDAENSLRTLKDERDTIEADAKKLLTCIEEITGQLENGEGEYATLKEEVKNLTAEEKKLLLSKVDVDQTFKTIKEKANGCNTQIHQWTAKLSQLELHVIPDEPSEPLVTFSAEDVQAKNCKVIELDLQAAQNSIKNMKPNLNVIEEYKQGRSVFTEKAKELDEITTRRNDTRTLFESVKNKRRDLFMIGYNIIKLKLKEMYQMITLGGDADFEMLDSCDPFAEGIQLNVRPPRKSWKSISNLSGGEKTLSSLALVFALHYYKPSPLYVMDEIDAALDFKNVSIVGNYIKERTKNAQFIVISLRSDMFELCDTLVGIYKVLNVTGTLAVDPAAFEENGKKLGEVADQDDSAAGNGDHSQENGGLVGDESGALPMDLN